MSNSPAQRLDRAVDALLIGTHPAVDASLRPLVEVAAMIRASLVPVPPGARFEERLSRRLRGSTVPGRRRRELLTPQRLLLTGAVGSAVGMAAAVAVWRAARR